VWITWKDQDTDLNWPLTFAQKVDLFYEQTLGWQLHIADIIANGGKVFPAVKNRTPVQGTDVTIPPIRHSGFPVLQICLSYFETLGKYTGVTYGSRKTFIAGVNRVFPQFINTKFTQILYEDARCGLYHNFRSTRVSVALLKIAIDYNEMTGHISICPELLPGILKSHLTLFREELLREEKKAIGRAFESQFDRDACK
jgi:hypothetical protein